MQEERPVLRVPLDIMMPFWGDPGLLRQTVQSVLDQTNGDWVLTVVDDAYPDPAVAEYFASIDDPRISYHRHDVNVGITANYEWCVAHATHDVVVILGCDDIMLPNYVDVILDAHARFPHVDIIQPGVQVIDGTGAVSRTLVDEVKQRVTMPRGSGARVVSGRRSPRAFSGQTGSTGRPWPSAGSALSRRRSERAFRSSRTSLS